MSSLLQRVALAGRPVDVLRLDRVGGSAPGNKWFKLQGNLRIARVRGARTLASFGGAWSNHLHALAKTARCEGFASLAWVRAEGAETAMLRDAEDAGMQLVFLSRAEYRRRHDPAFVSELLEDVEAPYFIPEGAANVAGAAGCGDILGLLPEGGADYHEIALACGTGSTLAGIASVYQGEGTVVGIPVLQAKKYMARDIAKLQAALPGRSATWRLDHRFHCGGYGRVSGELAAFIRDFETVGQVPLDPVYTAKLFYGMCLRIGAGEIPASAKLLLIHSGGLQGRRGFPSLFRQAGDKQFV